MTNQQNQAAPAADLARLWRKLSPNQRLNLVNELPGVKRVRTATFVVAGRALERHGLFQPPNRRYGYGTTLTPEGEKLALWAVEHGWAQQTETGWEIRACPPPRPRGSIDPARLAALAAAGLHAAAIARELGVSHEAVRLAAIRDGVKLPPRPKKERPELPPRIPRPKNINFRVSCDEAAAIRRNAARSQLSLADYLRKVALNVRGLTEEGQ